MQCLKLNNIKNKNIKCIFNHFKVHPKVLLFLHYRPLVNGLSVCYNISRDINNNFNHTLKQNLIPYIYSTTQTM